MKIAVYAFIAALFLSCSLFFGWRNTEKPSPPPPNPTQVDQSAYTCPVAQQRYSTSLAKLKEISNLSDYNLLLGDSVVYGIQDPRLYGMDGWVALGQNSQTSRCLITEISDFTALKPRKILLYIGGNDIDRGISYDEVCNNITSLARTIREAGIPLVVSELHLASASLRNHTAVKQVNSCLRAQMGALGVAIIDSPEALGFLNETEAKKLSLDGEHLNDAGNLLWINHIKARLGNIQ